MTARAVPAFRVAVACGTLHGQEINVKLPILLRPVVLVPLFAIASVVLFLVMRLRGPELPAYRITAQPLVQTVVATGRVISTSRAQVGSEIIGTVLERRVQEGDRVKAGDVLAVLRSDDLAARVREAEAALRQLQQSARPQAEAAVRQAEAQAAQATRERERRADLFARGLVAREPLEQAQEAETLARVAAERALLAARAAAAGGSEEGQLREQVVAARAQLGKTSIRAQSGGVVLTRNVEPGDLVQPGKVLFEIASSGATEIEVLLDEKNLAVLAVGQSAQCVADAYPDQPFPATVSFVAPGVDALRGTVTVRLSVNPVPGFLRQDMTISVNVETNRKPSALAVPNDSLLDEGGQAAALLAVRDGRLARVPVRTGLKGLAMTEVVSGITEGDVVLAGAASIADARQGMRVRVNFEELPATDMESVSSGELPARFD
jgi:HlyD family secretion protein